MPICRCCFMWRCYCPDVRRVYIGRHITLRMTREQFLMVVNVLFIASGGR